VRFKVLLSAGPLALAALLLVTPPSVESRVSDPPISGDMIKFVALYPPVPVPETPLIGADGQTIKLADLKGRLVLLNFWATWCAPCVKELPSIDALRRAIEDPDFTVLLVSIDRGGAKVYRPFLGKLGITSVFSASDPRAKLMRALKLPGIPTTLLISPDGLVLGRLIGDAEWDSDAAKALIHHYLGTS
jgi:thiol-disulfide isomerase/thioredoxin